MRGTMIKCTGKTTELIQWLLPRDYSISACSAWIYVRMSGLHFCCVRSLLATCYSVDMHQAEIKSFTRVQLLGI